MKRKWLLFMLATMTAIVLAACGSDDKKKITRLTMLGKKKKVASSVLGWKQATLRSTGHSKVMQMAQ